MGHILWLSARTLVLASGSVTRRQLLEAAGIPVEVSPAAVDERQVDAQARREGASAGTIAAVLARAKAMEVSGRNPDRLVLGADQTLECDGKQYDKPLDPIEGRAHLAAFSGRAHQLHSAAALALDGQIIAESMSSAVLTMRALSDSFMDSYVEAAGPLVMTSVGGYQLEGIGSQLFERIEGDHFTILGLPLLPLLTQLRALGYLAE